VNRVPTSTSDRRATAGPALPGWITPAFIEETRAAWQPFYEEDLTDDAVIGLLNNVGRLFEILSEGEAHEEEVTQKPQPGRE
jgi:hypothetical protein